MRKRDTINAGANMALAAIRATGGQIAAAHEAIDALLKIRKLNTRATNAWTVENNSGGRWTTAEHEASERRQERAWKHAARIAAARGWTIKAPGLYWIVQDAAGHDITARI